MITFDLPLITQAQPCSQHSLLVFRRSFHGNFFARLKIRDCTRRGVVLGQCFKPFQCLLTFYPRIEYPLLCPHRRRGQPLEHRFQIVVCFGLCQMALVPDNHHFHILQSFEDMRRTSRALRPLNCIIHPAIQCRGGSLQDCGCGPWPSGQACEFHIIFQVPDIMLRHVSRQKPPKKV